MKTKTILTLTAIVLCTTPLFAQKGEKVVKVAIHPGTLFAPEVYSIEPGIEAVLLLTEDQKKKMADAQTATIQAPALLELGSKIKKGESDAKAAQEKYQAERNKAMAEYKKMVEGILTAEQKATIKKVNDTVKGAIPGVLSAEQKEALEKASVKKTKGQ